MFKNWKWRDTWQTVGIIAIVLGVTAFGAFIWAPKNVDYYYMSVGSNANDPVMCVWAHWTWHLDEKAFCTDDMNRALDFTVKANAMFHK